MDLRKIKKLIELVKESGIAELAVSNGDESVRIVMPNTTQLASIAPISTDTNRRESPAVALTRDDSTSLVAPMAGTFYRAPHPEADDFVEQGQSVEAGDVLCIIESMKMMHEIRAASSATVSQICVANGQSVGTGAVLFRFL
ncbi:acetyl-CoA carboxylase biotin carboxyl carrier protein [bacterium]|jgi:acetyl-CoA carboxylase biotin carboxyl carrier protein|nr:acetyl-CoA carboxylase biotin carboxyl carrier protein [bacterium]